MKKINGFIFAGFASCYLSIGFAHSHPCPANCYTIQPQYIDPVTERAAKEEFIPLKYVAIAFHKPNYALPFYYTGSPANSIYAGLTPNSESLMKTEFKYQVSLKLPIWPNMFDYPTSLYFAYSLLSYWQVYSKEPFVRENDYEPEFFLANKINCYFFKDWKLNFFNLGFSHVSNGFGNSLQRSWDRIYLEAITTIDNWMLTFKPWVIIHKNDHNSDIGTYLGYASFLVGVKLCDHVVALEIPNIGANPRRTSGRLTWSFPLTLHLKGYVEGFTGYGQSLIEYNHRTNSFGIGLAASDWL